MIGIQLHGHRPSGMAGPQFRGGVLGGSKVSPLQRRP